MACNITVRFFIISCNSNLSSIVDSSQVSSTLHPAQQDSWVCFRSDIQLNVLFYQIPFYTSLHFIDHVEKLCDNSKATASTPESKEKIVGLSVGNSAGGGVDDAGLVLVHPGNRPISQDYL